MTVALTGWAIWMMSPAFLSAFGRWLDVGHVDRPATAAWILNGDLNSRPIEAALLYRQGTVQRVLVASVAQLAASSETSVPEHRLVRQVLMRLGVPARDIEIVDRQVVSTFDEAAAIAQWLREDDDRTVIVVTTDYHTRRSRWVVRRSGDFGRRIQIASARAEGYGPDNWWRHRDGFTFYLGEAIKFPMYLLLYGWLSHRWGIAGTATAVTPVIAFLVWRWCHRRGAASKVAA